MIDPNQMNMFGEDPDFGKIKKELPNNDVKPKEKRVKEKKYDNLKIIATLEKRIYTAAEKAQNISVELSGNHTHKRQRELDSRIQQKERLEGCIMALKQLSAEWEKDRVLDGLKMIRSINNIEECKYVLWPDEIKGHENPEWKERQPKLIEKAKKMGHLSREHSIEMSELIKAYCIVEKSDEEIRERELQKMITNLRRQKIPGFYPTPDPLIDKMLDYAQVFEFKCMHFLEPEAGIGDIADRIIGLDYGHRVSCIEIRPALCDVLAFKGHKVSCQDILETTIEIPFDRIIMNPPFEKNQDIKHIIHCYENFLKPGGILVSVASNGAMHNSTKLHKTFQKMVPLFGQFVKLEGGEFKGKEAFNQTGTSTILVVLRKPEE